MKISIKKQSGFTLIELLVVVFIIGVLSSIAIISLREAVNKAHIAAARADLNALAKGIDLLCDDTGLLPYSWENDDFHDCSTCVPYDYPAEMDQCHAGLECAETDSNNDFYFPNWNGPYVSHVPLDPWGKQYLLDFDFRCTQDHGCAGVIHPDWNTVRALVSAGPNGSFTANGDHLDDVAYILCDY
mgnify:FL=1|jgi:general secretion pathway protein G